MDLIVVVRVIVMCCVCGSCSDVLLLVEVVSVHSLVPAQPSSSQFYLQLGSAQARWATSIAAQREMVVVQQSGPL